MTPNFVARAAMCRRFAKVEPDNRFVWLAEAEKWSRLARTGCKPQVGDNLDEKHQSRCVRDIDPIRVVGGFYFTLHRPNGDSRKLRRIIVDEAL